MRDNLQLELDTQARTEAVSLEATGKLPAGFSEEYHWLSRREQLELRRLKAALTAAVDAATFVALARGEAVPASRLNPRIVEHHYRRLANGR